MSSQVRLRLLVQGPPFEDHCANDFSEMVRIWAFCGHGSIHSCMCLVVNPSESLGGFAFLRALVPHPPALASFQAKPLSDRLSLQWGLSKDRKKGLGGKAFYLLGMEPQ